MIPPIRIVKVVGIGVREPTERATGDTNLPTGVRLEISDKAPPIIIAPPIQGTALPNLTVPEIHKDIPITILGHDTLIAGYAPDGIGAIHQNSCKKTKLRG